MEKATSTLRRSGIFLLTYGSSNQELNMIIAEISGLKAKVKAIRDTQQTILYDLTNWTSTEGNRPLQELFLHLSDLNSLWSEVQSQFADQISEFKHQFEMILEGEKNLSAIRNKLSNYEASEEKAVKKLKKAEKKYSFEGISAAKANLDEIKTQKELIQNEVTEKVKENEAVKLIRIKDGFLKLTEAYLGLCHKCIYIFEAQKVILNSLPDVEDKEIHEVRFNGLAGAKDIVQRARTCVKEYGVAQQSSSQQNTEPPPPYSPDPYTNFPYNPYYSGGVQSPNASQSRNEGPSAMYPNLTPDAQLANAMKDVKISTKP